MSLYCDEGKGGRGRPKTTVPVILWTEEKKVLGKEPRLDALSSLAKNKLEWRKFSDKVVAKSHMSFDSRGIDIKSKAAYASNTVKKKSIDCQV